MSCFVVVTMYINESNSFCSHLNPKNSNSLRRPLFSFLFFFNLQTYTTTSNKTQKFSFSSAFSLTKHNLFNPQNLYTILPMPRQPNYIKKKFFKNSLSRVYCSSVFLYKLNNCTVKIVFSLNFSGNKQSTKPKPSKKKI